MTPYWIKFEDRKSACVEAQDLTAALEIAKQHGKPVEGSRLPYPAEPRLNTHLHEMTDGRKVPCPSFCYTPEHCKGHGSCPKNYACSE